MSVRSFDQAVSRLAQYRPFAHDGRDVQAAIRDLVLGAAAEAGGGFESLAACRDAVRGLWRLEIELDELRDVVALLEREGACVTSGGSFELSDAQHQRLEASAAESGRVEEKAFADWRTAIGLLDPTLDDEDFVTLRADLDAWIHRVISRHGVEAALILYPENPRARELREEIDAEGLRFLPERSPELRRVREQAIFIFVRQPTEEQRKYLSNLLNVAYFLTVLSLDPSASQLVQEKVHGQRIYLDTNVLYRALGLSKVREALSTRRVLELTKELGYELAITPWTLAELKESLSRAEQVVRNRALPPRDWAHLMAEATSEEGFVTAYWRQYKSKGVSPKDFFEFYSALEAMLAEDGINVVSDGCRKVERKEELIERHVVLLDRVLVKSKADVVLRHDVMHRLLIDQLRGDGHLQFSNARFWFLTQDAALPRYAPLQDTERSDSGVPFCFSTSAWAQVVRSLVPRTEDLDQALVDLLASPYMRYRGGISPALIQEVVGRIDQYEGVSANLASEVLLNSAFVRDLGRVDDEVERQDKIDNEIVRRAEDLHVRVEVLAERETEQRNALRAAEAQKQSSAVEVESAQARIKELQEQLAHHEITRSELEGQVIELERQHGETEQQTAERAAVEREERERLALRVAETETQLEAAARTQEADRRTRENLRRIRRTSAAIVLPVGGILAAFLLVFLGVVSGVWPVVGVCFAGLAVTCAGVWLSLGYRRAWQAFLIFGAVIGVVAGIQQIVASADDGASTKTKPAR